MFDIQEIKKFFFALSVKGAYVQTAPQKGRLVGLDQQQFIFSMDATSLYPSAMILNNISEETFYGRVYDEQIVGKFMQLLEATLSNQIPSDQAVSMIEQAFKMQFTAYAKQEKIQKQKDTVSFNVKYCTHLFSRIAHSREKFEDLLKPKTERQYRLLKSYLHPILEAITWANPYNKGYNNTIVDWVFFPEVFEKQVKGAWVLENLYSFKTSLFYYQKDDLKENIFKKYLLNPWGVLFIKHKDKLAEDTQEIIESMSSRKVIKNEMLVLGQLLANINNGNEHAIRLASYLMSKQFDKIDSKLISDAKIDRVMREKGIESVEQLSFEEIYSLGDVLLDSLSAAITEKNLGQNSRKVFMNSGFGIKGLISFIFSAPLLGNAITSSGKIYGIKVAQNVTAQYIDNRKLSPDLT